MKKKIFVRAPCLSQSGYGEQSRFALRALRSREDLFDIYLQPIPWGQTGWIWQDNDLRRWMDERITQTQLLLQEQKLHPDISLQITIPNEFERLCPVNIGYTAGIETTKVAPVWLQKGNEMNKVLVVSNHSKITYENTRAQVKNNQTGEITPYVLETPIEVVWENTERAEPEEIPGFELPCNFNFLMVSQMGNRKNFSNAIRWWIEEFIDQKVGLVIKTNIVGNSTIDFEMTEGNLSSILSNYPDRKCKIHLLHGDLSAGQMTALYTHDKIKAIVNIAHGEGFGLPLFEAAREGLPVVTIGWSGQIDFLRHNKKDYFQKVKHSLSPVQAHSHWEGVIEADSHWAYADQGSYKMTLRRTKKNWKKAKKTAEELKHIIEEKFSNEVLYSLFVSKIVDEPEMVDWMNWQDDQQEAQDFD